MKRTTREYFKACESCNSTGEIALGFEEQIRVCNVCDGSGRINVEETIEESDEVSGKAPKVYITDEQLQKLEKELLEDGVEKKYCKCCLQSMMSDDIKEFIEKKCGWVLMEPVKEMSWRKITLN